MDKKTVPVLPYVRRFGLLLSPPPEKAPPQSPPPIPRRLQIQSPEMILKRFGAIEPRISLSRLDTSTVTASTNRVKQNVTESKTSSNNEKENKSITPRKSPRKTGPTVSQEQFIKQFKQVPPAKKAKVERIVTPPKPGKRPKAQSSALAASPSSDANTATNNVQGQTFDKQIIYFDKKAAIFQKAKRMRLQLERIDDNILFHVKIKRPDQALALTHQEEDEETKEDASLVSVVPIQTQKIVKTISLTRTVRQDIEIEHVQEGNNEYLQIPLIEGSWKSFDIGSDPNFIQIPINCFKFRESNLFTLRRGGNGRGDNSNPTPPIKTLQQSQNLHSITAVPATTAEISLNSNPKPLKFIETCKMDSSKSSNLEYSLALKNLLEGLQLPFQSPPVLPRSLQVSSMQPALSQALSVPKRKGPGRPRKHFNNVQS